MGSIRVMRTCGMMGEVVGKAAYLCVVRETTPRGVYERYLEDLKDLLRQPGAARRASLDQPLRLPAGFQPPEIVHDRANGGGAPSGIALTSFQGIVVDDEQAKLTGSWTKGKGLPDYVAKGYQYASPKADATARYEFTIPTAGRYEVRLNYGAHENRASNAPVTIESADGTKRTTVNERLELPQTKGFVSLGIFAFAPGQPAAVTFSTQGADGNVAIDVVQLLPVP
jgi:hypothetical protein